MEEEKPMTTEPAIIRRKGNSLEQLIRIDHGEGIMTEEWRPVEIVTQRHRGRYVPPVVNGNGFVPPTGTGYTGINWAEVDWNKSSAELAAELGVVAQTVNLWRNRVGHPKVGTAKTRHCDWESVDWASMNNQDIARKFKVAPGIVAQYRFKLGKPLTIGYHSNRKLSEETIAAIDWAGKRDIDIAQATGISRERVRQIRMVRGLPASAVPRHHPRGMTADFRRWLSEHEAEIEGKPAHEVAGLAVPGLSRYNKYRIMRDLGTKVSWERAGRKGSHNLPVNWSLPNLFINAIWNKGPNWAQVTRYEFNFSPPLWRISLRRFNNPVDATHHKDLPEAVYAEIEKAEKLGFKPRKDYLNKYGFKL